MYASLGAPNTPDVVPCSTIRPCLQDDGALTERPDDAEVVGDHEHGQVPARA